MERVCRFVGHRVPAGHSLITPESMRQWAETASDSPLYHRLARFVADTPELMSVVGEIRNRPAPNLLFAAVQYLLGDMPNHPLAAFYPNLSSSATPQGNPDAEFAEFVVEHRESIVELGSTRYTQTNECRRCVALLPGVWEAPFDSFHLIDVGTSAGLNLVLDHYRYRWGPLEWGPTEGLLLDADSHGALPAPREIEVLSRIGLDLNPVDTSDPDQARWLDALVWPEHEERRRRLREALKVLAAVPVDLIPGSALDTLPATFESLPAGEPVVVMNSMVLVQWDPPVRAAFEALVASERRRRPVHRVSMEWFTAVRNDASELRVDDGSGWRHHGWVHHHGAWVDLATPQGG